MVIHTNMTGIGGMPSAKSNDRSGANSKTTGPSDNSPGAAGPASLDSQIIRTVANVGSDIEDGNDARESAQFARGNILNRPAAVMLAQANLSPETVFNLLQE